MKTIAAPAMAAIEAGEAIVTGAVEILTSVPGYELVDTITIDMLGADLPPGQRSIAAIISNDLGYEFSADPAQLIKFSPTPAGTYSGVDPDGDGWRWPLNSIGDDDSDTFVTHSVPGNPQYASGALAVAAVDSYLGSGGSFEMTGHSTYRIWPDLEGNDDPLDSSHGGLSVTIEVYEPTWVAGAPIRLWGGYGPIEIDGDEYQGIGARGLAQQSGGAIGGIAQGLMLTVSGIEPAALELLNADEIKGGPAVLYRMIFASDGKTLLDAHVFDRGRVDTVDTDETIGGQATINVAVESAARGLGRSGARRRADSDQRLIDPDDGYFKNTSYAGQKTLYWGGKRPRYGSAG